MCGATITDLNHWIGDMMRLEKISNYELDISGSSVKGDGYLGEVTFLKVNVEDKGVKSYHLVIKSAKKGEEFRKNTPIKTVYDREIYMYTKIFPIFREFQIEKNIESPFNRFPKCYSVCLEDSREAIILQNLKSIGYDVHDRTRPQNLNHALMVFRNYGKFHALSFALKYYKPSLFSSLTKDMTDVLTEFFDMTNMTETFVTNFKYAIDLLKESEGSDSVIVKKYEKFSEKEIMDMVTKLKQNRKQSIITHGDCWNNNMMFKYEGEDRTKPIDMKFLDFQLSTVGSPVCDLSYYLYSCGDKTVFQHFDFLLQAYYSCLSDSLKEFQCDPDDIITLKELTEHWKKYGLFGLVMSPFIVKLELTDPNEVVDLADNDVADYSSAFGKKIRNQGLFDQRVVEVFTHFANKFL